ncbi:IclR family transcriptional regulator [Nocardioidaceae bacterium SCSIO 66511]|nr:IclR family transcriptional regulator [Nocardioidaceae bacterium SCSIO 66511]
MPGHVQSVERAMAVLTVLGRTGRPLALYEIAAMLDLAKPTAHGIVRTLQAGDFVRQDRDTRRYSLGKAFDMLEHARIDPHDLRSIAMGWTDSLAALTRLETLIAVPTATGAEIVHHVFRPDNTPQDLRIGELLPLHATAAGKSLLAFAPGMPPQEQRTMDRFTRRTVATVAGLEREIARVRESGTATDRGEYRPGIGGIAVPLRGPAGLGVAALEVVGQVDRLFDSSGVPDATLTQHLGAMAKTITRAIGQSR